MNKRLVEEYGEFIYKGEPTPLSLGTLSVVIFCTVLLIVATFTKLDITYWSPVFNDGVFNFELRRFQLVPQIPVVMFASALLGVRFASLVILIYLLVGFFLWPVFGFGGGLEYVKSYFFGYILGFFAAGIFAGKILSRRYGIKHMIYASVIAVLSIHTCGILYSFILELFNFSGVQPPGFHSLLNHIISDVIFSVIAVFIAKPVKFILWIAMKNEPRKKRKPCVKSEGQNDVFARRM